MTFAVASLKVSETVTLVSKTLLEVVLKKLPEKYRGLMAWLMKAHVAQACLPDIVLWQ